MNIDNPYLERMVSQIYPAEHQLNKANTSDNDVMCLDLHLSILDVSFSSKIYDNVTNAMILISTLFIFQFLDGDVSRTTFHGVHISQLTRFLGRLVI